jgi:hypothetical protein
MVNHLSTITIKVKSPSSAESNLVQRGFVMKKAKAVRGFWSWLMGQGWDQAGSNG